MTDAAPAGSGEAATAASFPEDRMGKKKKKEGGKGVQKGAQTHAEGMHGSKTREKLIAQLEAGQTEPSRERHVERAGKAGKRRLVEEREQHGEKEKNSEKQRLQRYLDEHGLIKDGYDVPGGH